MPGSTPRNLLCRLNHRALRHHREGVGEAAAIFGAVVRNGDGEDVPTLTLGLQHLEEDTPRIAAAKDWLAGFEPPDLLPLAVPLAEELAEASVLRFGGVAADYQSLHGWFLATVAWAPGPEHLAFRHHAFGCFEAEARFGPVLAVTGGNPVPTRVVAERHVQEVLGRAPLATEFLRRVKGERWMLQATSPRRLGLDRPASVSIGSHADALA